MDGHVWLIGMMGAGKTRVGRVLAVRLGVAFVDTDAEVERRLGCSIAELWGSRGEAAFRQMEAAALQRAAVGPPAVVATGGGAVLDDRNVATMRSSGTVVWLDATPEVLELRVAREASRPLLAGDASAASIATILDRRRNRYEAAAHLVVDTDHLDVQEVATRIEELWRAS